MAKEKGEAGEFKLSLVKVCWLTMAVISVAWTAYILKKTPAWKVYRAERAAYAAEMKKTGDKASLLTGEIRAIGKTAPFIAPDIATSFTVFITITMSLAAYARRLQVYIKGQGSGEMGRIRGLGLQTQTYDANINRKGGIKIN